MGGEGRATFERRDSKYGFDVGDDALSSLPPHTPCATSSPMSPYSETMQHVQRQHDIMNNKPNSGRVSSLIVRYGTPSPPKRRPSQESTDVHKDIDLLVTDDGTISPPRKSCNTKGHISSLIARFEATAQEIIQVKEHLDQPNESEEPQIRGFHEQHTSVATTSNSIVEDITIADGPMTVTSPHSTDSDICTKVATSCFISRFKATTKVIMDDQNYHQEGVTMDQTSNDPSLLTNESLSLVQTQDEPTLALVVKDNLQVEADAEDQGPMQMILEDVVNGCANDESDFGAMKDARELSLQQRDIPKEESPAALSKARDGSSLLDNSNEESFSDNSESATGGSSKRRKMKIELNAKAVAKSDYSSDRKLNDAGSDDSEEVPDRYSSPQRHTRETHLTMTNNLTSMKKPDEVNETTDMKDEGMVFLKIIPESSRSGVSAAPTVKKEGGEEKDGGNDDHQLVFATESAKVISQIKLHLESESKKDAEDPEVIVHIRALEQSSGAESRCSQFSEVSYVTPESDHGEPILHAQWDAEFEQNRLGKGTFGQGKSAVSFQELGLSTDWGPAAGSLEWGGSEMPGYSQSFDTSQTFLDWEVSASLEWEDRLSPDAIQDPSLGNQRSSILPDIVEDVASPCDLHAPRCSDVLASTDPQDPAKKLNARIAELKAILGKLQNNRGERESSATEMTKAKSGRVEATRNVPLIPSQSEPDTKPVAVEACKKSDPSTKEAFDRYDSLLDQLLRQNKALKRGVSASETSLGDNSDIIRVRVVSIRSKRDRAIDACDDLLDSVLERKGTPKRGDPTVQPAQKGDKYWESRDLRKNVRSQIRPTSFNPRLDAAYRAAEAIKSRQIQEQSLNGDTPINIVTIELATSTSEREATKPKIGSVKVQRRPQSAGRSAKLDNAYRVAEAVKARQLRDESPAAQSQPDSFKYHDRAAAPAMHNLEISKSTESKQRSLGTPEDQERRRRSPGRRRKERKDYKAHLRDRSRTVSKSPRHRREERLPSSVSLSPKCERGRSSKSQVKDTFDGPLRQQSQSHKRPKDNRRPTISFSFSPQRTRERGRKDNINEATNSSKHRKNGRTKFSSSLSPSCERLVKSSRQHVEKNTIQSPLPFLDHLENSQRDSPPDTVSADLKRPLSLDLPSMNLMPNQEFRYQPSQPRGVRDSPPSSGSDLALELDYCPSPPSRRGVRGPQSPTPPPDHYQELRYESSPLRYPDATSEASSSIPDRYQELGSQDEQPTWPDRYQALQRVPSPLRDPRQNRGPRDCRDRSSSPSQMRHCEQHVEDRRESPHRKFESQMPQHDKRGHHSSLNVRSQSVPRSYEPGDIFMPLSAPKVVERPRSAPRQIRCDEASPRNPSRHTCESASEEYADDAHQKHNRIDGRDLVSSPRCRRHRAAAARHGKESEKTKFPSPERHRLLGEYSDQTRQLRRELDLARLTSLAIRNTQHSLSLELQAFKHKLMKHRDCKRGEIEILTACHVQLDSFQRRMKATKKTLNAPQHAHQQQQQQEQARRKGCTSGAGGENNTKPRHHSEMRRERDMRIQEAERGWEGFSEISRAMKSNLDLMNQVRKSITSKPYAVVYGKEENDEDTERLREIQRLMTKLLQQVTE